MTQFERITLRLLCKILMRLLQAPGARGTAADSHFIDDVQALIQQSETDTPK